MLGCEGSPSYNTNGPTTHLRVVGPFSFDVLVVYYIYIGDVMANIRCTCGMVHRYTATALAALVEAAQAGDMHTVGIQAAKPGEWPQRVTKVRAVCLLTLMPQNTRIPKSTAGVH